MNSIWLLALLLSPQEGEQEEWSAVQKEVVVTATRGETTVDKIGSSVTIIGADEIQKRKKTTVLELLRTVPGLEVVQTGAWGGLTSVFLRGGSSSHTLVLLDGVRANSPTTGQFDFGELTANNVERIEIIRGPQSTLYGSEAIGGVINVITKRGQKEPRFSTQIEVGTESTFRNSVNASGGDDKFDYTTSISFERTQGVSAARESAGNTEGSLEGIIGQLQYPLPKP